MVSLDDAVIARLESHGHTFEVYVDPDRAQVIRQKKDAEIDQDDLVVDKIFSDARGAEEASDGALKEVFGTTEVYQVAKDILTRGEIQLTTEQRKEMVEQKRKAIINYISRNAMDPQTGNPHPPQRIENAMNEAKYHVDPFEPVEAQVQELLDKLRPLLPIKIEQVKVRVRIPAEHAGATYGVVKSTGTLLEDKWQSDGSWEGVVELPAGLQQDFYSELNKRSNGNVETQRIRR